MVDMVLYFFRRQKLYLYFGLLSILVVYSYLLGIYFLSLSSFTINLFNLLTVFSLVWLILFFIKFSKNKQNYTYDRQIEKQDLLRHQITLKYKLNIQDNIFSKVDLITSFMKDKFSSKGLLSIRVLKITNSSLSLYIDNLKIKNELNKALALSSDKDKQDFYNSEIQKNTNQNTTLEENLDNFIKELMSKNNNDDKIDNILNEFEYSTKILTKIKQR